MELASSAFERSSGDSQNLGNEQVPTPNRLIGVFAGLRAKLIIPYVFLTLLVAMVGVYVITRLVTSSLHARFRNQLMEASRAAGRPSWPQSIPATAVVSERGQAKARNVPPNKHEVDVRFGWGRSNVWALV